MLLLQPHHSNPRMMEYLVIKTTSDVTRGKKKSLKKLSRTEKTLIRLLYMEMMS